MSLTINLDTPYVERISRNLGVLTGTIDFDSSYPTGGESCSGISRYFKAMPRIQFGTKEGYLIEHDYANNKAVVKYPTKSQSSNLAGSVTVTGGTGDGDAGTFSVNFTGTKGEIDAGVAEEVANGTDLSSLTGVSFIAIGRI